MKHMNINVVDDQNYEKHIEEITPIKMIIMIIMLIIMRIIKMIGDNIDDRDDYHDDGGFFRILSSIGAGILGDGGHVDSDYIRLEIKDHLVLDLLLVDSARDMIKTLVG